MNSDFRIPTWAFKKHLEGSIIVTTLAVILAGVGVVIAPQLLTLVILLLCLAIWCLVLYFFRDPDREIQHSPNLVLSPGDGAIRDITLIREKEYLNADLIRIGIFLSIIDVHVQRAPLTGRVAFVNHQKGKNLPAYKPASSYENEQITMGINTESGLMIIKQISGILARKCFNYSKAGDQIQAGERYGLIKFGSRVEIFLPANAELLCTVGDKVKGGLTILAKIPEKDLQNGS